MDGCRLQEASDVWITVAGQYLWPLPCCHAAMLPVRRSICEPLYQMPWLSCSRSAWKTDAAPPSPPLAAHGQHLCGTPPPRKQPITSLVPHSPWHHDFIPSPTVLQTSRCTCMRPPTSSGSSTGIVNPSFHKLIGAQYASDKDADRLRYRRRACGSPLNNWVISAGAADSQWTNVCAWIWLVEDGDCGAGDGMAQASRRKEDSAGSSMQRCHAATWWRRR
jgi:hypothetical protein